MGINPAVYITNIYLFTYERQFVLQLLLIYYDPHTTQARRDFVLKILKVFQWVRRYIDDIIMITRHTTFEFLSQLLYTTSIVDGIHCIYPPCLRITSTSQPAGITAKYMDIFLC